MKRQELKQLAAHDKILIFNNLRYLLEGLEEYIEKAGFYPNFKSRRQLRNITIPKERTDNLTADSAEHFFKTNLILYVSMVDQAPPSEKEKLVQEYYKWINSVGIDPNNCPEKLKNFLVEVKSVLEGDSERIIQQTKEYLDNKDKGNPYPTNPQDTLALFGLIQKPLNKNREDAKSYEGKSYRDVEITNKLSGDAKQGEQIFGQVSRSVSSRNDFHFYPRTQQSTNLNEVVQEVKTNPQNWNLDEVATEINRLGWAKKQELAVYCRHARLDAHDDKGKLNFNNNPIYLWENFNSQQRFEIKKAKSISGDYLTNEEIKWVVKEFKENPRVWRTEKFKRQECLVHNSAQGDDSEFGTLIHSKQKFSDTEWVEVNRAFERIKLIDSIKKHINEFEFQTILTFSGQYWDNINKRWVEYDEKKQETMLVHKSVKITENDYNEHGHLNIKTDKMFQGNRFNQEEWAEIQSALKVNSIKQNAKLEKGLFVLNCETGEVSENEDWFIFNELTRKFDDKTGYLIYVPNLMIRAKDLSEAEQKEVGYKLEVSHQAQASQDNRPQGGGGGFGGTATWGFASVVSLIGLAFTK